MKVSGFSFIRNGLKLDYPFIESIQSILPICDEFLIAVGDSEDETLKKIIDLQNSKIKIIPTVWDETIREGGRILAQQTDIALREISGDWGFYLQGDEVIHEKFLPLIKKAMEDHLENPEVEGLLFNYKHFYGSYDFVGNSPKWYRREVRIVRNKPGICSYRDAQGFRRNGRKLRVKKTEAEVYHYGWVRNPKAQQLKQVSFNKLWHDDQWVKDNVVEATEADYNLFESLLPFNGTHPAVMQERLKNMTWKFHYDPSKRQLTWKEVVKINWEKWTGYRLGEYRNYKII